MPYQTINPFTEKLVKTFPEQTDEQLQSIIAQAEDTYRNDWSKRSLADRKKILKNAVKIFREKHEEFAQCITLEMGKLLTESRGEVDLSADILEYYADNAEANEQAATVVADPRIKGVALTGSERAGSAVAAVAGKALKKSTMELGGADAFIVLGDADMDKAIEWAIFGRMNNAGQCCVAAKRFILEETIADEFLNRFKGALAKYVPGDPTDPKTTLAPLCTERALTLVESQIESAVKGGATVLLGGKRVDRPGYFLEPTILTNIKPENPVFHQEFFAPVALIFRVKNDDEAVKLANDSPYGLGGSVITKDIERGKRIARQIDTGMVFINQATWTAPDLPFGGVKNSGYGRELSDLGIGEFVNKKLIRVA